MRKIESVHGGHGGVRRPRNEEIYIDDDGGSDGQRNLHSSVDLHDEQGTVVAESDKHGLTRLVVRLWEDNNNSSSSNKSKNDNKNNSGKNKKGLELCTF